MPLTSIATFASMRPYEFIRNGPLLHLLPVRIVGVGAGLDYGHNGITHYALEDVAIMRAQPEVREQFWKTFVEVAKTNPGALRYIVMLMALYLHLGPFAKRVISEIDRRIAELDGMSPVRATVDS